MFFKRQKILVNHPVLESYFCRSFSISYFQKRVSVLLTLFSLFQILSLLFFIVPPPKHVQAASDWLSGWSYRTPIVINNNIDVSNDYQAKVTLQGTDPSAPNFIDFNKALADGADIRFTDSDKTAQIPYWIESWNNDAKTATVWVNISSISTSSPEYFKYNISSSIHNNYGLSYPITYEFNIPSGSSGLIANKKNTLNSSWAQISEKTSNDFFNGIEVVRFDYDANKAYVSVSFDASSDDIYLNIVNENGTQVATYQGTTKYYDNRKAAAVFTADDWNDNNNTAFKSASDAFTSRQIWFTPAIITATPTTVATWNDIQNKVDAGYIEPASHSRTHVSCTTPGYDYASEVGGSRDDIINNLDMPALNKKGSTEYVYAWTAPFGETNATTRSKLSIYKYLEDTSGGYLNNYGSFTSWDDAKGLYNNWNRWNFVENKTASQMNDQWDSDYAQGIIYHIGMHPVSVDWSIGSQALNHLDYIKGKKDVWYAGMGHLYLYNYTRERADQRIAVTGNNIYLNYGKSDVTSSSNYENVFAIDYGESGLMGLWLMDEVSGNLIDSSGNGNTGTIHGASRTAHLDLQFDGTDDYVTVSDNDGLDIKLNDLAILAWIKTDVLGANRIVSKSGSYQLSIVGNILHAFIYNGTGFPVNDQIGSRTLTDNSWHQVVWMIDRDGYSTFYVDGSQDGTPINISASASQDWNTSNNLFIGSRDVGYGFFNGTIDGVRIYNHILTNDERLFLYQDQRRKYDSGYYSVTTSSVLRSYHKLFKGVTNIISSTDYISYSAEPDISNLISSGLIITPPSGSASTTITDSLISLDYSNSILPGMTVNNVDREIDLNNNGVTSLIVNPSSGNLNITVNTWNTTGNYSKNWTEENTVSTATAIHTIGDLAPSTYYQFKLDGTASTTAITGSACNANGSCLSDINGSLTFTYQGGYSTHTFALEKDVTGPHSFTLSSPANNSSGSTRPTLSWNATSDSESGLAKYQLYIDGAINRDNISSSANSSDPANDLSCGSHTWYIRAIDKAENTTDSNIFNVSYLCGSVSSYQPTHCSSIVYDEWQTTCVNGWQYRNIKSQSPSGCSLTSAQKNDRKRQCGTSTAPATETTPTVSTPTSTSDTSVADSVGNVAWKQILNDAEIIATGDVNQLLAEIGVKRNLTVEAEYSQTIVKKIVKDTGASVQTRNAITNFVTYGTPTTQPLGTGERAGVVNSFNAAFGKLPTTQEDWEDVIKIANGRWPGQISKTAEDRATISFKKIYLRNPDRTNSHDDAAITVMAYGLRPANRNMESEKAAIKSFKAIYGYNPVAAMAWDVVRAIAYSGATR